MAGEAGWLVRDTVGTGLPFEAKRLVKGSCSGSMGKRANSKRQTVTLNLFRGDQMLQC